MRLKHCETTTCLTLFFEGDTRKTPSVRRPVFSRCLMHCLTIPGTASHSPGGPPPPLSLSSSTPESLPVKAPPFDDSDSDEPPWKTILFLFQSWLLSNERSIRGNTFLQEGEKKRKRRNRCGHYEESIHKMKLS